jgi:dolichol-phosphate mannosyltransferase
LVYGLYFVVWASIRARDVPGFATLITAVTFLGGIQLIFLGVIGEYIALIFDEVKDRPRYLVARRLGPRPEGGASETGSAAPASHKPREA